MIVDVHDRKMAARKAFVFVLVCVIGANSAGERISEAHDVDHRAASCALAVARGRAERAGVRLDADADSAR